MNLRKANTVGVPSAAVHQPLQSTSQVARRSCFVAPTSKYSWHLLRSAAGLACRYGTGLGSSPWFGSFNHSNLFVWVIWKKGFPLPCQVFYKSRWATGESQSYGALQTFCTSCVCVTCLPKNSHHEHAHTKLNEWSRSRTSPGQVLALTCGRR